MRTAGCTEGGGELRLLLGGRCGVGVRVGACIIEHEREGVYDPAKTERR